MKELVERIKTVAVHIGDGIIKVDEFLNHQVDPFLITMVGVEFAHAFRDFNGKVTKILTAETSGICPAYEVACNFKAMLVYARKQQPITMPDGYYLAKAPSRTKPGTVKLMVSREYLGPYDRVLLIDDWLASGRTIGALALMVRQARAELLGIGCVIEKRYEDGRRRLERLGVPIISLATVDLDGDRIVVVD